jgi:hypothetical protein
MEGDEKQKLLQMSEISIQLDTYEDIFSDFDPRPFSQRAISDDLLLVMKKAAQVKASGNIEVKFLIPKKMANSEHETLIKRRFKEYFKKHHELKHKEVSKAQRKAGAFIISGAIISMLTTYLIATGTSLTGIWHFFLTLLIVLCEPAGWFFIWDGLSRFVSIKEENSSELNFYDKMLKAEYEFTTH